VQLFSDDNWLILMCANKIEFTAHFANSFQMTTDTPFKKPNTAIVMLPKIGKLTAMGRKLFNSMLHSAQKQLLARLDNGAYFDAADFFDSYLCDLIRPIGSPTSQSLEMMKGYVREMQSTRVEWASPDASSGVVWESMVLISQAKIRIDKGKVRLQWSFPPDIVSSLADPERFTIIRLEELAKLTTYAAVALYEIAARYADNPSHKTSVKSTEWWVRALSSDSHKRSDRDKDTYVLREWRWFKPEKVRPAIDEINSKTSLRIEMVEFKEGRAIKNIQFNVHRTPIKQKLINGELPDKKPPSACHIQAAKLGISERDITVLLENGHHDSHILLAVAKCEARSNRSDLDAVGNMTSYFRRILLEIESSSLDDKQGRTDGMKNKDFATAVLAPVNISQKHNSENSLTLHTNSVDLQEPDSVVTGSLEALKIEISKLGDEKIREYIEMARLSLQRKGLLTPGMVRRLNGGAWDSGSILSEIVKFHQNSRDTTTFNDDKPVIIS
jgi:plasmid replication initiation protein